MDIPVQIPILFHAVDLQAEHVNVGSLYAASIPAHPVQTVALVHPVQLLLQALLSQNKKFISSKLF